jgi:hypothetical protein
MPNTMGNDSITTSQGNFNRKLSKREKKDLKKKEKEQKLQTNSPVKDNGGIAQQLYNELPESSFTRSISNPELVMRKRRQLKLEKKLQQIRSTDGGPDSGTLHLSVVIICAFACCRRLSNVGFF